jgi:hypothetical protein
MRHATGHANTGKEERTTFTSTKKKDSKGMVVSETDLPEFFENSPELLSLVEVQRLLGVKMQTIYDWRYRSRKKHPVPRGLFWQLNGRLRIRKTVLLKWLASQNTPSPE